MQSRLELAKEVLFKAIDNGLDEFVQISLRCILEEEPNSLHDRDNLDQTFLFRAVLNAPKLMVFALFEFFCKHAPEVIFVACGIRQMTILHGALLRDFAIELLERIKKTCSPEEWLDHINKSDYQGATPLIRACRLGNYTLVKWLCKHGAYLHYRSNSGTTPILYTCKTGNKKIFKWLYKQGADLNDRANNGDTYLHQAVQSKKSEWVKWLLEEGGINTIGLIHQKNAENKSPFDMALDFYMHGGPIVKLAAQTILQIFNDYFQFIGENLPSECLSKVGGIILFCSLPLDQWQLFAATTNEGGALPLFLDEKQPQEAMQQILAKNPTSLQKEALFMQLQRLMHKPRIPYHLRHSIETLQKFMISQSSLQELILHRIATDSKHHPAYFQIKKLDMQIKKNDPNNLYCLFQNRIDEYHPNKNYYLLLRKLIALQGNMEHLHVTVLELKNPQGLFEIARYMFAWSTPRAERREMFLGAFLILLLEMVMGIVLHVLAAVTGIITKLKKDEYGLILSGMSVATVFCLAVSAFIYENARHTISYVKNKNFHTLLHHDTSQYNHLIDQMKRIISMLPSSDPHADAFTELHNRLAHCHTWQALETSLNAANESHLLDEMISHYETFQFANMDNYCEDEIDNYRRVL